MILPLQTLGMRTEAMFVAPSGVVFLTPEGRIAAKQKISDWAGDFAGHLARWGDVRRGAERPRGPRR